ncbi:hypothetical protein [Streptomyces sp. NBC_00425]|uniref:hypothetical protein n=1 Tax=Streptomyces sp. NBC_00425 TaxID=2975740 RepID=UPI002E1CBDBE
MVLQADPELKAVAAAALEELDAAEDALSHQCPWYRRTAHLAVAQTRVDMAQCLLLRLLSEEEVKALLPGIEFLVSEQLPESDPRKQEVKRIASESRKPESKIAPAHRETLADATWAARLALQRETARAGSFVHTVYNIAFVLAFLAALVAVLGGVAPELVPICFQPESDLVVCPTAAVSETSFVGGVAAAASSWDFTVVEVTGLIAAAVAAAVSLRGIKGTSSPYNIPVALAVLKLPTGALTGLLGLLLMRGQFVPGLTALDSSAQIVAYAIIFGYAQQIATRFVDKQGQAVLNAIGDPTDGTPSDSIA